MPWNLIGMIGAPILAVGLAWVWISDAFTIRGLRRDLTAEKEITEMLTDSINNPQNGWRVRLQTSQSNVMGLQEALTNQNAKVALLEAEGKARTEAAARALVLARAERDRLSQRITAILNMTQPDDPADIIRQAELIVLGSVQ